MWRLSVVRRVGPASKSDTPFGDLRTICGISSVYLSHFELMDNMFLPRHIRAELPAAGAVDGTELHELQ